MPPGVSLLNYPLRDSPGECQQIWAGRPNVFEFGGLSEPEKPSMPRVVFANSICLPDAEISGTQQNRRAMRTPNGTSPAPVQLFAAPFLDFGASAFAQRADSQTFLDPGSP
jgi:hypothetical protein